MQSYESLKAFISCASDVQEENEKALKIIERINETCKEVLGIEIGHLVFKDFVPQTTKLPDETIQERINEEIKKCEIFILIVGKRYGTKETGYKLSNTEREVEVAIDLLMREKKIIILTYFKKIENTDDPGKQLTGVVSFRKRLKANKIMYREYGDIETFTEALTHDLFKTILTYKLSTTKQKMLRKFWLLGIPERPTQPNLAILYPAMERTFMGPSVDRNVWINRLEPNVVFEDFKALDKIQKTLRLIGYNDYRIYNSACIPSDIMFMNKFWICLPRNSQGLLRLEEYRAISNFKLIRQKNKSLSHIVWKKKGKSVKICSPLGKYLREQRKNYDLTGEWHKEFDDIIAKDYAVIARFCNKESDVVMKDGCLFDYFLFGIRGLGTWGAAWFIDRKYNSFEKSEKKNIQLLLEIEYRDGRIYNVKDVSGQTQYYFDNENSMKTIKRNISRNNSC
jgi:hypothetical protein